MTTLVLTFVFMLLLMTAMAIGVLAGRKPISGSCGGMKALGMDVSCEVCGGDPDICKKENAVTTKIARALAIDVGAQAKNKSDTENND